MHVYLDDDFHSLARHSCLAEVVWLREILALVESDPSMSSSLPPAHELRVTAGRGQPGVNSS